MKASRRLVTRAVVQQVRLMFLSIGSKLTLYLFCLRSVFTELFVCLFIYLVSKTNPPLLGDIRLHFDCRWVADSYCLLYVHDWWCHEEIHVIRDVWSCRPTDIIGRQILYFFFYSDNLKTETFLKIKCSDNIVIGYRQKGSYFVP